MVVEAAHVDIGIDAEVLHGVAERVCEGALVGFVADIGATLLDAQHFIAADAIDGSSVLAVLIPKRNHTEDGPSSLSAGTSVNSGLSMPQPMPHGPKWAVRWRSFQTGLVAVPLKRPRLNDFVWVGSVLQSASQWRRLSLICAPNLFD